MQSEIKSEDYQGILEGVTLPSVTEACLSCRFCPSHHDNDHKQTSNGTKMYEKQMGLGFEVACFEL